MDSGEIVSVVGDQAVVVPSGRLPDIGVKIFVKDGIVGRVADIIGAVDRPYYVVKLSGRIPVSKGDKVTLS